MLKINGKCLWHRWRYYKIYQDYSRISLWSSQTVKYRECKDCGIVEKKTRYDKKYSIDKDASRIKKIRSNNMGCSKSTDFLIEINQEEAKKISEAVGYDVVGDFDKIVIEGWATFYDDPWGGYYKEESNVSFIKRETDYKDERLADNVLEAFSELGINEAELFYFSTCKEQNQNIKDYL